MWRGCSWSGGGGFVACFLGQPGEVLLEFAVGL